MHTNGCLLKPHWLILPWSAKIHFASYNCDTFDTQMEANYRFVRIKLKSYRTTSIKVAFKIQTPANKNQTAPAERWIHLHRCTAFTPHHFCDHSLVPDQNQHHTEPFTWNCSRSHHWVKSKTLHFIFCTRSCSINAEFVTHTGRTEILLPTVGVFLIRPSKLSCPLQNFFFHPGKTQA